MLLLLSIDFSMSNLSSFIDYTQAKRPDFLLRRWRYINHLLTYFLFKSGVANTRGREPHVHFVS